VTACDHAHLEATAVQREEMEVIEALRRVSTASRHSNPPKTCKVGSTGNISIIVEMYTDRLELVVIRERV
jgi:hypothetical protein